MTDGAPYLSAMVPAGARVLPPTRPVTFVGPAERLVTVRYGSLESFDPFIGRHTRGETVRADAGDLFAAPLENPQGLPRVPNDPDNAAASRVRAAVVRMKKVDVAARETAFHPA